MSEWTHPMCDDCWEDRMAPREPARITDRFRQLQLCCFCGKATRSGIFVREDPQVPVYHQPHEEE